MYKHGIPFLPQLITLFIRFFYSCYLPHTCQIGKNFILGYGGLGTVIHQKSIIGNNCLVSQNVTIGGDGKSSKVPFICDNVKIGAGSILLGDIKIGDGCIIGANSTVLRSVQAGETVVGIVK